MDAVEVALEVRGDLDGTTPGHAEVSSALLGHFVLGAGLSNTECPTLFDVFPALRCLLQQQQMDLLALEWVVVVKPPRVDERHVASRCG